MSIYNLRLSLPSLRLAILQLQYAHAAAPNVKLYINDYNVEGLNSKSDALYAIAQDFVKRGVPLHGVGLEAHFIGGSVPQNLTENMQRFSDLGLEAAITELDVRVPVANDGTANSTWLDIQAKDYADVVQACLNVEGCPGITVCKYRRSSLSLLQTRT